MLGPIPWIWQWDLYPKFGEWSGRGCSASETRTMSYQCSLVTWKIIIIILIKHQKSTVYSVILVPYCYLLPTLPQHCHYTGWSQQNLKVTAIWNSFKTNYLKWLGPLEQVHCMGFQSAEPAAGSKLAPFTTRFQQVESAISTKRQSAW
jgi:hypothetical protein